MHFLKSKRLWLSIAHIAVMGAGAAGVILFPPAAMFIAPAAGAINALIPSPLSNVAAPQQVLVSGSASLGNLGGGEKVAEPGAGK